jgi:hypothetical protein
MEPNLVAKRMDRGRKPKDAAASGHGRDLLDPGRRQDDLAVASLNGLVSFHRSI